MSETQKLLSYLRDPQKPLLDRIQTFLNNLGTLMKGDRVSVGEELLKEAEPLIPKLQSLTSQIRNHLAAIRKQ